MVGLIQPAVKILSQGLFDLILQAADRFDGGLIGRHLGRRQPFCAVEVQIIEKVVHTQNAFSLKTVFIIWLPVMTLTPWETT